MWAFNCSMYSQSVSEIDLDWRDCLLETCAATSVEGAAETAYDTYGSDCASGSDDFSAGFTD